MQSAYNKSLQVTFDPLPIFAVAKTVFASNAPELKRWAHKWEAIVLNKMLLRLYAGALAALICSAFVLLFLGVFVPKLFADVQLLSTVAQRSVELAPWAFIVGCSVSVLWGLVQTHDLCQWYKGSADVCHRCGGIVAHRVGRYGSYVRCLSCRASRKC